MMAMTLMLIRVSWVLSSSYGKGCMMMVSVKIGVMIRVSIVMIKNGCVVLAILVTIMLRGSMNIIKDEGKDEGEHQGDDDYGFGSLTYNGSLGFCDDGRFC